MSQQLETLITYLQSRLQEPLPGHDTFLKDSGLLRPRYPDKNDKRVRKSAVLISLYSKNGSIYTPLILRPKYDGTHGGQMAFPGGSMESYDESYERTALREAEEEIGLKSLDVKVLGSLTDIYIKPSNYWVKPVVGFLNYPPTFFPDAKEVDKVYEMDVLRFLENPLLEKRKIQVRGAHFHTVGFILDDQWIWGATALMLAELKELLHTFK